MSSWKTTVCGLSAVVVAALTFLVIPATDSNPATAMNWAGFGTAAATGIGLLFARDNKVSSEKAGAK